MTSRLPTEVRRLQIADAALALVAADGIASLTTTTLAKAVGITPGALFRHFASLDAILEAVAARADELLRGSLPSRELPPLERLEAFVVARLELARSARAIPRLVLSEQFTRALPDAARARLRVGVRATFDFVREAFEDARRAGLVRDDLSASELTTVLLGTLQMNLLGDTIGAPPIGTDVVLRRLFAPADAPQTVVQGRRGSAKATSTGARARKRR